MGRAGAIWVNLVDQVTLQSQIEDIKNQMEAWGYTIDPEHIVTRRLMGERVVVQKFSYKS